MLAMDITEVPSMKNALVVVLLALMLAACGSHTINVTTKETSTSKLYRKSKDPTALFAERYTQLKAGMSRSECLAVMGVTQKNIEHLSVDAIRELVWGQSRGNIDFTEGMRWKDYLATLTGAKIPLSMKEKNFAVHSSYQVNVSEAGYDMAIVLIFEHDKLTLAHLSGLSEIDTREIINVLPAIFSAVPKP